MHLQEVRLRALDELVVALEHELVSFGIPRLTAQAPGVEAIVPATLPAVGHERPDSLGESAPLHVALPRGAEIFEDERLWRFLSRLLPAAQSV